MPPVEDHPVHHSTKVGSGFRYGCHGKPRQRKTYQVKNGFVLIHVGGGRYESVQMWKTIDDFGSIECRYDGGHYAKQDDPACEGCQHYKTSEYVKRIMENGK